MRLLLDTHVLLWWLIDSPRLGPRTRSAIAGPESDVLVSAASCWEIAIKRALGRLDAPADIADHITSEPFRPLDVRAEHAWMAGSLPSIHHDPFDRMLVAQARVDGLTLVTDDAAISRYDVHVLAAAL